MDGARTLETIARELAEHFPGRFARWTDALNRVGVLSKTYSRRSGAAPG
jgi:hypothetical protein